MNKDAQIIGIWGGRGSGKSTRAKEIVERNSRLIVFDPIGDWAKDGGFVGYKSFKGLFYAVKQRWNGGFRVVYTVQRGQEPQAALEYLADALFKIQKPYFDGKDSRQITLVIEEMALSYPEKTAAKNERNMQELVNLGRHYGVNIIGISQRMAEVKKNFVGNCAEHYFFRMGAAVDYDAAARQIGRQHIDRLRSLATHEYLLSTPLGVESGKNKCIFFKTRKKNR